MNHFRIYKIYLFNRMDEDCDMCYEYQRCTSEKCTTHTLLDGNIKEFAEAVQNGRFWGDIIYEEDEKAIANETANEKATRLRKKAAEERKAMDALKESCLNKNRSLNCVKQGGTYVLKHKFLKACKNLELPDEVLSDGSKYGGGCWANDDNICPFMHPEDKGKFDFKGKTRITLVEEPRNFSHRANTTRRHSGYPPRHSMSKKGGRRCSRRNGKKNRK